MRTDYDHLYLSAHFDDVALSCGGQIFQHTAAGGSVLVVTVTAAEPPEGFRSPIVESLHRRWADSLAAEPEAMVAQRRAEDRAAFSVLGADVLHLPFLDCIYRPDATGDPLYPGPMDMFGSLNPADATVVEALAAALADLPAAGQVYLPLGVGGHIDHQVTRLAGESAFDDAAYYEDYPYTMAPGALEAVLPLAARGDWPAETVWLSEAALAAKVAAVAAYRSQLSSFFTGPDDLAEKLLHEGERVLGDAQNDGEMPPDWAVGAERLWRRRAFTLNSFE
jgi:LmbE family N-acetylglucosaminyl deacetylase